MERSPEESAETLTAEEAKDLAATKELFTRAIQEQGEAWGNIIAFVKTLREKYHYELEGYRLYHTLIGSTPGEVTHFDLAGDDSIAAFAKRELEAFKGKS